MGAGLQLGDHLGLGGQFADDHVYESGGFLTRFGQAGLLEGNGFFVFVDLAFAEGLRGGEELFALALGVRDHVVALDGGFGDHVVAHLLGPDHDLVERSFAGAQFLYLAGEGADSLV